MNSRDSFVLPGVIVEREVFPELKIGGQGELLPQKWTNFYLNALTRFAMDPSLRLRIRFEVAPEKGIAQTQVEEIVVALQELGLSRKWAGS